MLRNTIDGLIAFSGVNFVGVAGAITLWRLAIAERHAQNQAGSGAELGREHGSPAPHSARHTLR